MDKIVAIQECTRGNGSVGEMWVETQIFDINVPVAEIIKWSNECHGGGKLIITVAGKHK